MALHMIATPSSLSFGFLCIQSIKIIRFLQGEKSGRYGNALLSKKRGFPAASQPESRAFFLSCVHFFFASTATYFAALWPAIRPSPTALAIWSGRPVQSPAAKTPGRFVAMFRSTCT